MSRMASAGWSPQSFIAKRGTRAGFEISLKGTSLGLVAKGGIKIKRPRHERLGRNVFAGVVLIEPLAQIGCEANVVAVRKRDTGQAVDVVHAQKGAHGYVLIQSSKAPLRPPSLKLRSATRGILRS